LNKIGIAGAILAVIAAVFFLAVLASNPYPTSQLAAQSPQRFINATSNVGVEDSQFMWNNLSIALAGQSIVIFAAAAGCLAILRIEEKKEAE
jgi:uncharacterized membrane-anchored protein